MIKLKHLHTLQELQKQGSITAAARNLYLTQSALSHQLNRLEERLGFLLFFRKSNPVKFTVQGKILLELSKKILPEIKIAMHKCQYNNLINIRLAIECHSCIQWLVPTLNNFKKDYPNIIINFNSSMILNPQKELERGKLDIVFTSDILPTKKIFYWPIFDFELRLVLSPDHKLAKRNSILLPIDLASEIFIVYPIQQNRIDIWRQFLNPAGIIPNFKYVDNTLLIIQMVSANMGISALPCWVVDTFEKQGIITTKRIGNNGISGKLYAAMRNGDQYEPIIQSFIYSTYRYASNNFLFIKKIIYQANHIKKY